MRRRLFAALLDYFVVLGWLAVLVGIFVPLSLADLMPWERHPDLVAFLASVLPVWLYLTVTESTAAGATWGKRRTGLRVLRPGGRRAHPMRVAVRNAVKVLPWQLAHLGVMALWSTSDTGTLVSPGIGWLPISAAYALLGLTLALMFIRSDHAALHDLIAGTRVRAAHPGGIGEPATSPALMPMHATNVSGLDVRERRLRLTEDRFYLLRSCCIPLSNGRV